MTTDAPALSPKQAQVLAYLREHQASKGYSPTIEEMRVAFGVASVSTIAHHLNALQRKGRIVRVGTRAIAITDDTEPADITASICPHCHKERTPPPCP